MLLEAYSTPVPTRMTRTVRCWLGWQEVKAFGLHICRQHAAKVASTSSAVNYAKHSASFELKSCTEHDGLTMLNNSSLPITNSDSPRARRTRFRNGLASRCLEILFASSDISGRRSSFPGLRERRAMGMGITRSLESSHKRR